MSDTFRFNAMHFMPYAHLPENHKDFASTWVSFPNKYYDPQKGFELYQEYTEQMVLADRLGLRRHRPERTPQYRLQHDGDAEHRGRLAGAADRTGADLRVGGTPELHASQSARGGIRHTGRVVERPARDRVSARNG